MRADVELDQQGEDKLYFAVGNPTWTKQEIEECVILVRLELYNRGLPCGPQAIQMRLEQDQVHPLPSARTIARILSRQGLTHGRTGFY